MNNVIEPVRNKKAVMITTASLLLSCTGFKLWSYDAVP